MSSKDPVILNFPGESFFEKLNIRENKGSGVLGSTGSSAFITYPLPV